jgi:AraC-like DNA-binding protein
VGAIEQSYDQHWLTVADIAGRIFTSKRQLQRAFAEAGTSFQATLHAIRMERSAELLVESSLPVSAVAGLVGYRQPTQFAKAFRRYYELAPTQLRHINSNHTEVVAMNCQCGCENPSPPADTEPLAKREGRAAEIDRRLDEVDRRIEELDEAA